MNDNDKRLLSNEAVKLPANPERYAGDVNLARHAVFASKNVRGYRTLPAITEEINGAKVMRQVSVGTYKNTGKSLDEDDELVYLALFGRWEKNGCNMDERKLTTALMNTTRPLLVGPSAGTKQRRLGVRDYEKLRNSLDKLARVPIEFDNAYETNDGIKTETIQILESLELFNRKEKWGDKGENGGKYFEFTTLELNRKICQNIKDGKIKLVYLDQFASIRSETGRLFYKQLERLGGVIESPFRREAFEFAKECTIDIGPNGTALSPKLIIQKMRRGCKEIRGRIITCGVIGHANITFDKQRAKWFFVCPINKIITIRSKKTRAAGSQHVVPDRKDLDYAAEVAKDRELAALYEEMPMEEQVKIDLRAKEIHRDKFSGYGPDGFAKKEALREYFGLEELCEEIKTLVAREREHVAYIGKYQRAALSALADVLRRFGAMKLSSAII